MAEEDLDLGESDPGEGTTSDPKSRRLVTQSYDLSVSTLLEQWADGTLKLPEIQRQYVWDDVRASRLIESLLLNIPIPVVYFSETEEVNYLVIDGHQRIQSIARYVNNDFPLSGLKVLSEFSGLRFQHLPEREQRQIKTRVIRAIILGSDSDPSMMFDVFERLNTGSIALNAQEIRNSTHQGRMNEQIKLMTTDQSFRDCIGTKSPRQRMVDNELILRFFALRDGYDTYRPPLSRFLNDYMSRANEFSESEIVNLSAMFHNTAESIYQVFGAGAFRLTDANGKAVERNINRALAEAQFTAFSWVSDVSVLSDKKTEILQGAATLYQDPLFLDSIQRATGDRRRTRRRIGMYGELLNSLDIPVSVLVSYEKPE